ncbi:PLDc N-terminal domain-containing protein [Candidatus Woesearchaeota archaeon]|nr:PLDc N-terminal domain-containing protein [Candidatus Woesearchaeota archaeon]
MAEPLALFGALSLLFLIMWVVFFAAIIFAIVFWVKMIIDAAKREFPNPNDKVIWILVLALTGILGALIYYFVVKRKAQN